MCQSTNNPAETTRLLNEIDSAFAGIEIPPANDHTKVIYIEEIKAWLLQEPAIELPCDDEWAAEDPGIDGDHPTGYEADDERPYGWDVPEEEYPDW